MPYTKTPNRKFHRLIQGLVLGLGAPLGWALISYLTGLWDQVDPDYRLWLFIYIFAGSTLSFGIFGFFLGKNEERLSRLSVIDHLTRCYNTRFFHEMLQLEFSEARRNDTPLCLVLLDLDHFKSVNDTHGHQAGDKVLVAVAQTVRENVRSADVVSRVGGEEFAVIMPRSSSSQAVGVADRIRQAVRDLQVPLPDGARVDIRVSLGVAGTDVLAVDSPIALFAAVDRALYQAKESGRDRTVLASPDMPEKEDAGRETHLPAEDDR